MAKKSKHLKDRFAAAETRPQFRSVANKNQSKIVLDDRFASVLTDSRFQLNEKDKYGRRRSRKQSNQQDQELSAFYTTVKEKDSGKNENEEESRENDEAPENLPEEQVAEASDSEESSKQDKNEDPASRIAYLTALSRGELDVSSSSEESDDDDEKDASSQSGDDASVADEAGVYGKAGILDPTYNEDYDSPEEYTDEDSPYLVATNMDWEHLRAVDIFSILSSFVSPGCVRRVQVYASNFGMERMAKDRLQGPTQIWKNDDSKPTQASDDEEEEDEELDDDESSNPEVNNALANTDFDPEKLRAYEASKLKYYFAVVEFAKPEDADIAYREVNGMEFEHSSSAIDLRALPADQLDEVIHDRPMRDEATNVPSNYDPPEFIVSALQQTNVQCTWDQGDTERERKLTKYGSSDWQKMTETDDLKAYLASDGSSDEESDDDDRAQKGQQMRKMLGLDDGDDDEENEKSDSSEDEGEKEIKFIPGAKELETKIRNKLESKEEETQELTPWQKYQEKRKQKRKERRQAARNRRDGSSTQPVTRRDDSSEDDDDNTSDENEEEDNFFLEDKKDKKKKGHGKKDRKENKKSGDHELELLLAGEHEEEEARDFDIRGLQRLEKNKDKKMKGSRKRKEDKIAADVSGKDFQVNVSDSRFAAVLDGSDSRFGIDKTDPNYKDTSGMREILSEQTKRRNKKRKKNSSAKDTVVPDVSAESGTPSSGANALSALVQKLKTRVGS